MPGEKLAKADGANGSGDKSMLGISVDELTAQDAQQLGLPPSTKGVVVTDVDPDSKAADAGLHKGDVIQQVNRMPVTNAADFARAVRQSNGESVLLVNREGNRIFLAV
jgi:serine protease Do